MLGEPDATGGQLLSGHETAPGDMIWEEGGDCGGGETHTSSILGSVDSWDKILYHLIRKKSAQFF